MKNIVTTSDGKTINLWKFFLVAFAFGFLSVIAFVGVLVLFSPRLWSEPTKPVESHLTEQEKKNAANQVHQVLAAKYGSSYKPFSYLVSDGSRSDSIKVSFQYYITSKSNQLDSKPSATKGYVDDYLVRGNKVVLLSNGMDR